MENLKASGYAPVNGINMYHEIHGEGTIPLVLLHGGGATIEVTYAQILPILSKSNKVIAVELQAHGRTSDRNASESFEQDADDVAALLKYLKIDKANILGFSNGGTTTLQIAIRHPEVVNKIIDVAGAYQREGFFPGFFDGFEGVTIDMMPTPLKTAFLKVTPDNDKLLNMFHKDVERMKNFKDIPDESIRGIKVPALIITGSQDVMPVEHAVKLSHMIPGAQLAVLPGTHGACLGEVTAKPGKQPEATAILVQEFLDE
ncbi:alpha/beta hydrolase [Mucilaginibacter sp. BT774]|nr:alpha/beta hydrolase [Mucilaginibacter sp. BT774]